MERSHLSKALVVDDDDVWLGAICKTVRACGIETVTACDLRSARDRLDASFDVVITEVVVRHESCFSLLSAVRRLSAVSAVIAISARAPRPIVFRLMEFGATAYLEKPFTPAALRSAVAAPVIATLAVRPTPAAPEMPAGLEVDTLIELCRERYRLTGAEADVLRCALQGLSHREIADERARSLNTIKTLVRSLLTKSGAPSVRVLVRQLQRNLLLADLGNVHRASLDV